MKDLTGVTPLYARSPYGDQDDRVRAIYKAMNLTPVLWSNITTVDFDTEDWDIPAGVPVNNVVDNFEQILNNASALDTGFIVLEHDLYPQTVDLAIGYILPGAMARGNIKFQNVVNCLGKPLSDAYLETNNNATNPPGNGASTIVPGQSTTASSSGASGQTTVKSPTGSQTGDAGQASPTNKKSAASQAFDISMSLASGAFLAVAGSIAGAVAAI